MSSNGFARVRPYGEAIFTCIAQNKHTPDTLAAMYSCAQHLRERRAALVLCDSATIPSHDLMRLFAPYSTIFGNKKIFERLILLLHKRHSLSLLPDIITAVAHRCAVAARIGVYTLDEALPLTEAELADIDMRVRAWGEYHDSLVMRNYDPDVIAGCVLKGHDGWSADYSIRGSLARITRRLKDEGFL